MYMDDVIKSVFSVEKAVGLWHDFTELLGLAGMKIRKWCSNIPVEDGAGDINLEDEKCLLLKA